MEKPLEQIKIKMNLALSEKEKIVEICRRNDISFCAFLVL
jgi:hypothetical protein